MKKIVDGVLCDTETSKEIYKFHKKVEYATSILSIPMYQWRLVTIYETLLGNYFLYYDNDPDDRTFYTFEPYVETTSKDEVKRVIAKLNVDKYIELFGTSDLLVW